MRLNRRVVVGKSLEPFALPGRQPADDVIAGLAVEYMIPSHASYEPGYAHAVRELGLEPALMLDMRLGEGSGCPMMFMVADAACAIIRDMGTFAEAAIDDRYLENIKGEEYFSTDKR